MKIRVTIIIVLIFIITSVIFARGKSLNQNSGSEKVENKLDNASGNNLKIKDDLENFLMNENNNF
ncbi:hypothetical protein MNBD_IGNAVI01-1683 [hydrothermal vent metagenome]|uniref:Uncharacterized protein n=1 Tax=hydrothermal vent metagenome TaxID=652676 RepID=A0A3B1CES2_9ZZZZ